MYLCLYKYNPPPLCFDSLCYEPLGCRSHCAVAFNLYDLNRDGKIDHSELKSMVYATFEASPTTTLTEAQVDILCQQTLQATDANGNGVIELDEFSSLVYQNPNLLAPFTIDVAAVLSESFQSTNRRVLPSHVFAEATRPYVYQSTASSAATAAEDGDAPSGRNSKAPPNLVSDVHAQVVSDVSELGLSFTRTNP